MLEASVQYAQAGYSVFPCRRRDKRPMHQGWQRVATRDPAEVERLWSVSPEANIALPTGSANGLWVLDADGPEGLKWLCGALQDGGGAACGTVAQMTGGGGAQLFFALASGQHVSNSVSRLAPNVDVRGEGGYVIVPPSLHPSGNRYQWSNKPLPPVEHLPKAPAWLAALVEGRAGGKPAMQPGQWRDLIESGASEGDRNDRLTRLVGHLLNRDVDLEVVGALACAWNDARCRPPLDEAEVDRIVTSIARRELEQRGAAL